MKAMFRLRRAISSNFMCMAKHRILRFNELLKKELGTILLEEIEFPEGSMVTIANVDTSPDLQHAVVYISIIPDAKIKEVLAILSRNIFKAQQGINARLRMRPIPKIEWAQDQSTSNVLRVGELLEKIEKEQK